MDNGHAPLQQWKLCVVLFVVLSVSVVVAHEASAADEGFETGDFSSFPWMIAPDGSWTVVDTEAHEGTYSASSSSIADDSTATLEVTLDITTGGYVTYWTKTSTEPRCRYAQILSRRISR